MVNHPTEPPRKEPAPSPAGGVYYAAKPQARVSEHHAYVPRFLSAEFFAFIAGFVLHPGDNAVYLKEWRKTRRRLGKFERHWYVAVLLLCVLSVLLAIPVSLGIRAVPAARFQDFLVFSVFFVPALLASVFGFFSCLYGNSELSNKAMLEELAMTRLRPQEIVFGQLIGGILPFSYVALPMLPGVLLLALDITVLHPISQNLTPLFGLGMLGWFFPYLAVSLLASASISSAVTYGVESYAAGLAKALIAWLTAGALLLYLIATNLAYTMIFPSFSAIFFIGIPILIVIKLAIAGAFLQHLAHRVAELQAREEVER